MESPLKPVCVFGLADCLYTKMVVSFLQQRSIPFEMILVKGKRKVRLPRYLQYVQSLINTLYSGNFISLSKRSIYPYKLIWDSMKYNRSQAARRIMQNYDHIDLNFQTKYIVPDINHVRTYKIVQNIGYDWCIFAGVDIVDDEIIATFKKGCLNAHPAPLPECRGAGAIQFTLYRDLKPAASVHYATAEIDAGSILRVSPVKIIQDETINSLTLRLTEHCAKELVDVLALLNEGQSIPEAVNEGKLNYWKDCKADIQKGAAKKLKELRQTSGR